MIVKIIKNLENRMEKIQKSINKDLEELKNKHTETNNTITEIKNTPEGTNSRISEAEEQTSELENKMVEITSEEQNKAKRMKRTGRSVFGPWVGKIPWSRERLPTPVFWPGEFHGLYSPWGRKELDTTE